MMPQLLGQHHNNPNPGHKAQKPANLTTNTPHPNSHPFFPLILHNISHINKPNIQILGQHPIQHRKLSMLLILNITCAPFILPAYPYLVVFLYEFVCGGDQHEGWGFAVWAGYDVWKLGWMFLADVLFDVEVLDI